MSEVVKARQCFQEYEWIEIFKARKVCGKSVTRFCKDEHITESSYYYWLKKIREKALTGLDTSESQPIVPVQLKQTSDFRNQDFENQEAGICIRIGEISIDIREDVSSEMICDVVNAVRQSC